MSVKMIATRALRYAGRAVPAGVEFSVKGTLHARVLTAIGHARQAPAAAPPPAPRIEPEKPRRHYKRRDMIAESGEEPASAPPSDAATGEP